MREREWYDVDVRCYKISEHQKVSFNVRIKFILSFFTTTIATTELNNDIIMMIGIT